MAEQTVMDNVHFYYVEASQLLHTEAGLLLGKMYYGSFLSNTLKDEEYLGYPHNGNQHSLTLKMKKPDIDAFCDIVLQTYPNKGGKDFVATIKENYKTAIKARVRINT